MGGWFSGWCYSYWVNAKAVCKQEVGDTVWLQDLLSKSSDIQGVCGSLSMLSTGWVAFSCSWAQHFHKQKTREAFLSCLSVGFTVLRVRVSFDHGIPTPGRYFWKTESYFLVTDSATLPLVPGVSGLNLCMKFILMSALYILDLAEHQEWCWHSSGILSDHEKQDVHGHHVLWGANIVLQKKGGVAASPLTCSTYWKCWRTCPVMF